MANVKPSTQFRDWLAAALPESGMSKSEVARRMALKHPLGVTHGTKETARRTLNKILAGTLTPTRATQAAIAEALGRTDAPADDDEESEQDLPATLQALAREQAELSRRLSRALRAVEETSSSPPASSFVSRLSAGVAHRSHHPSPNSTVLLPERRDLAIGIRS